jgi:hypothetical protein
MSVKDLQGNDVSTPAKTKLASRYLFAASAVVLIVVVFGYRVFDCTNFNHSNRQRLRNLENYGAAATLRDNRRDWKYPWLVKDISPVKLVFFDHPRFKKNSLTDADINQIARLIDGLPNVPSVHIARKSMSPDIVSRLEEQLDTVKFTTE